MPNPPTTRFALVLDLPSDTYDVDRTINGPFRQIEIVGALNADLTAHTGATAAHGATGAVVGTTNAQTLTNKTLTSPTLGGTVGLIGTGLRITGDFGNATRSNRPLFQASVTNNDTHVGAIPNGTSRLAGFSAYDAADPNNASILRLIANNGVAQLEATNSGTGVAPPLAILVGGSERMRIDASGQMSLNCTSLGFFSHATNIQIPITGPRGGIGALQSLLTALAAYGLIVDNTTA